MNVYDIAESSLWQYCDYVFIYLLHCVGFITVREQLKELTKQYDKSENDLKALQSVGQVSK